MIDWFFIIILSMAFGWVSRMCGGGGPKLPWGIDQPLYAIPHGVLGFMATKSALAAGTAFGFSIAPWAIYSLIAAGTLIPWGFAFAGKRLGHGQWFDLGTTLKLLVNSDGNPRVEFLDPIVRWVWGGVDPNTQREGPGSYRRDYIGLAISGAFISLGSCLVLILTGHFLYAGAVIIAGISKPIGYAAGLLLAPRFGGHHNEYGEFITGFIDVFVIGLILTDL